MKNDLVGKRFGRLVVVGDSGERRARNRIWSCLCDCGNTLKKESWGLNSGHTQSCGCLQRDLASQRRIVDHAGRKFGMLTVISMHSAGKGYGAAYAHWLCRCDCGSEKIIRSGALVSGETVSCGCAKRGARGKKIRDQSLVRANRRRAIKIGAGGSFTPDQVEALYAKQRGRCANCGDKLGDQYHRDHKVPLSRGGTNDILNIELLCGPCNLAKHAKDPVDWAQENGRLL